MKAANQHYNYKQEEKVIDEEKKQEEMDDENTDLLDDMIELFESELESLDTISEESELEQKTHLKKVCKHTNTTIINDNIICCDCGEEIGTNKAKQWSAHRYGKPSSGKLQLRKSETRSIRKELEGKGISKKIADDCDKLYQKWYSNHTLRASKREGAIYAALFFAYKQNNQQRTSEEVMEILGTKKSDSLKGLKEINMLLPKDSPDRNLDISPETYIRNIMNKLFQNRDEQVNREKQIKRVIRLYHHSMDRSHELSSARPKSYAAAVIFHWITEKKKPITLQEFSQLTDLASTTIKTRADQVSKVLKYKSK